MKSTSKYEVFWGTASSCAVSAKTPEFKGWMNQFIKEYHLQNLVYLKQEHLATGLLIDSIVDSNQLGSICLQYEGDFLMTSRIGIGIAVLTADCLPIVFYDSVNKNIAVAHAGWKGTLAGIAVNVVKGMAASFQTKAKNLKVFFGPHARTCCYEVQVDFIAHIAPALWPSVLMMRDEKFYFDSAAYNRYELERMGVLPDSLVDEFSCTMCDPTYHSRRRNGVEYVGQSTIVWLQQ